jgi:hypothetical protein
MEVHGWQHVVLSFNDQLVYGLDSNMVVFPVHTSGPNHWSVLVRLASETTPGRFDFFYIDSLNSDTNLSAVILTLKRTPLFDKQRGDNVVRLPVPGQEELECGALSCLFIYLCMTTNQSYSEAIHPLFCMHSLSTRTRDWIRQVLHLSKMALTRLISVVSFFGFFNIHTYSSCDNLYSIW